MRRLHGRRHPADLAPDLKRAALEQVDAVGAVAEKVERELDVHRVLIDRLQDLQHAAQIACHRRLAEQPVERDERIILGGPGEVQVEREVGSLLDDVLERQRDEFVLLQVEAVHAPLRMLAHIVNSPPRAGGRAR